MKRRSAAYASDPQRYWDTRHRSFADGLRSVGSIGVSDEGNELDYGVKLARIGECVDFVARKGASSTLEAGCGSGVFTALLTQAGLTVTALDFSRVALGAARRRAPDAVDFIFADLTSPLQIGSFDFVVCIDVLFHIVDDTAWQQAIRNLASHTAKGGWLLIQEHLIQAAEEVGSGSHVRWRMLDDYTQKLGDDFTLASHVRYALPSEPSSKDLLLWERP